MSKPDASLTGRLFSWRWTLCAVLAVAPLAGIAEAQVPFDVAAAEFDPNETAETFYGPGYRLIDGQGYRDPDGRAPTKIGLRLIQLSSIDGREETFAIEALLYVVWSDDWGDAQQGWSAESVDQKLKTVRFRPVPEFENGLGTRERYGMLMTYDPRLKRIKYEERFSMSFSSDLDFRKFPFDHQQLAVNILVSGGTERLIDLQIYEFTHRRIDESEWYTTPTSYASQVEHNIIPYDIEPTPGVRHQRYPRARFSIDIHRRSGFYYVAGSHAAAVDHGGFVVSFLDASRRTRRTAQRHVYRAAYRCCL